MDDSSELDDPAEFPDEGSLVLDPPVTADSGFEGFVYVRDQWPTGRIPGARILFVTEDGRYGFTAVSNPNGEYSRPLWPGRYRVSAKCPGYLNYSTCCGYFVCRAGERQVGNVPLLPEGPVCRADGTYGGTAGYDPAAVADQAPEARIEAEPRVVARGEPVTIHVSGLDDRALVCLWWGSLLGCAPECGRAIFADCGDANPCAQTWEVRFDKAGWYVLFANARDDAYAAPGRGPHQASEGFGMGCVDIVVTE